MIKEMYVDYFGEGADENIDFTSMFVSVSAGGFIPDPAESNKGTWVYTVYGGSMLTTEVAADKGLKERVVIYKHAFRNTLIPMVTSLAGLLPSLFSGAIITEQVFDLPGIGNIALDAMNRGDIPFIMGYNMFLALLSVIGVLLADLMYGLVDPRVKLE
jgi:ABC-type antimicrobial peptide transport system permease subunit